MGAATIRRLTNPGDLDALVQRIIIQRFPRDSIFIASSL